jgi:hypothetical protein
MQLKPIEIVRGITRDEFNTRFVETKTPVILKDFLAGSPALKLWDYPFFKQQAGELPVSVHGAEDAHHDKVSSLPDAKMKFGEYLDLIQKGPNESRLFLFNLLLERPELKKHLVINKLVDNILTSLPFLFFGGEGSSVRYHYDIDMSHVFLSQFEGEKKVWLFSNDQSDLLYRLPYNFHGIADLRHPDYEKFPALQYLHGWECSLHHGDTLFMPEGFWHYIQYVTQGFSVSHRALSPSYRQKLVGLRNIFIIRRFDTAMRKIRKEKWFNYKTKVAFKRANKAIEKVKSREPFYSES